MGRKKHTVDDIVRLYVRKKDEGTGCWEWIGPVTAGYSKAWFAGRSTTGHRLMYRHFIGEVPSGLQLDHLCRNRLCVNPHHLEPVTAMENNCRNPNSQVSINMRKTNCVKGHELSGDNLYINPKGNRECKACRSAATSASIRKRGFVGVSLG